MMHRTLWFLILPVLGAASCAPRPHTEPISIKDRLAQGSTRPSTQAPRRSLPIATVNDQPIDRSELTGILLEARGLPLLQQLILRETARQEAERLGLQITKADFEQEYDLTVQGDPYDSGKAKPITPARREQMIEAWSRKTGVPRAELDIAMQRQSYLRKIVASRIAITDTMLEDEHRRRHSEKVQVRHIQLSAQRVFAQIQQRLSRGERFEDMVADYSQNILTRMRQGMMPHFTADDPTVPAVFRKVAFSMNPGDVSNLIEAEGSFHVLKLERRIPAETVSLSAAREDLRRTLRARLITEGMESRAADLLNQAKIQIAHPGLKEQYNRRLDQGLIEGPKLE